MNIPTSTVVSWMNALRNLPADERYRALEGFWDTQLASKCWIVDTVLTLNLDINRVYVFGGWTGVLSSLLLDTAKFSFEKVYSIDIDPWCESIARTVCSNDSRFVAVTADMAEYKFDSNDMNVLAINTSTEHVTQDTYDRWYDSIPTGTIILIQGNNFFTCPEHIRCTSNIKQFLEVNRAKNVIYSGELSNPQYTRYMGIFYR